MTPIKRALLSGIAITAHNVASGKYFDRANPTGWHHATFSLRDDMLYMRGENGSPDWPFATLVPKPTWLILHPTLAGQYSHMPFAMRERVAVASRVALFLLGASRKAPEGVEIKAPAPCALCGRKLTAGRSLTLQDGPEGLGFYGPVCGSPRDKGRAAKHKAGLSLSIEEMHSRIQKGR